MERVAQPSVTEPREIVENMEPENTSLDAVDDEYQVGTDTVEQTFEQTGDPLLLIGRARGQLSQVDTAAASSLSSLE